MSQAEIKTKLTADGSELSRAFDQGMTKAASFRTQVGNLGKTIGAAFTFSAALGAFSSIAKAQEQTLANFKELENSANAFKKQLEQLREKVEIAGAGGGRTGISRALTDYKQALREARAELKQLEAEENIRGAAGVAKFLGDLGEKSISGGYTKDELRLSQLRANVKELEAEEKRAQKRGEELGWKSETQNKLADEKKVKSIEKEWMDEEAKARAEKIDAARRTVEIERAWLEEEKATREAMDRAQILAMGQKSEARNLLMGFMPGQDQRFSNLRRMGANELGSGVAARDNPAAIADKIIDKVTSKIAEGTAAFKDYGQKVLQGIGSFI